MLYVFLQVRLVCPGGHPWGSQCCFEYCSSCHDRFGHKASHPGWRHLWQNYQSFSEKIIGCKDILAYLLSININKCLGWGAQKNFYMFDTPWCIVQTSPWQPNAFGAILLLEGLTHIFRRLYEKMFWKLWTETSFHWRISPHSQGGWYIHIFRKGKKVPVFLLLNVQVDSLLLWDSETCLPADCPPCCKSRHLHSRSRTITLYGLLAPARAHYIMMRQKRSAAAQAGTKTTFCISNHPNATVLQQPILIATILHHQCNYHESWWFLSFVRPLWQNYSQCLLLEHNSI